MNGTAPGADVGQINSHQGLGQSNPAVLGPIRGFVNGDTPSALGGTLTYTTAATAASAVGGYAVTPSGLTSGNYTITFSGGTLTVTTAALTVTANNATKIYGQANPAFSVTYAGFATGETPSPQRGSCRS